MDPITDTNTTVEKPADVKPAEKPVTPPADKPAEKPAVAAKPADASKAADDDEDEPTPDDKGNVTIPFSQFLKRVGRMTRRELRKHFGTDKLEDVVAERKELETLRTERDEQKRKEMSEKQKLEDDLKKERDKVAAATARADEAEVRIIVKEQDRTLRDLAVDYVSKEDADDLLDRFAREVRRHPDEYKSTKAVKAWFAEFVEKHPKWAKEAAADDKTVEAKKAAAKKEEPAKVPLNNGAKTNARPAAPASGGTNGEKTARPGQTNSMSKAEIQKKFGVSW